MVPSARLCGFEVSASLCCRERGCKIWGSGAGTSQSWWWSWFFVCFGRQRLFKMLTCAGTKIQIMCEVLGFIFFFQGAFLELGNQKYCELGVGQILDILGKQSFDTFSQQLKVGHQILLCNSFSGFLQAFGRKESKLKNVSQYNAPYTKQGI